MVYAKVSISNLHTTSHEYVYRYNDLDRKLSELIWESKNTKLLGVSFDYIIIKDLFIDIGYKTILQDSDSVMDDYDWIDDDNPTTWSHHSHHPNTKMKSFNIIDISINKKFEKTFYDINSFIMLGYKKDYKKFEAYDGNYTYSSSGTKRDSRGDFNGSLITYSEKYSGLYLGFGANKKYNNFNIFGIVKYSPSMSGINIDNHRLRYFTNTAEHESIEMKNIELQVEYLIATKINIYVTYNYTEYTKSISNTLRVYYGGTRNGEKYYYNGNAMSNKYDMLTFGIKYEF